MSSWQDIRSLYQQRHGSLLFKIVVIVCICIIIYLWWNNNTTPKTLSRVVFEDEFLLKPDPQQLIVDPQGQLIFASYEHEIVGYHLMNDAPERQGFAPGTYEQFLSLMIDDVKQLHLFRSYLVLECQHQIHVYQLSPFEKVYSINSETVKFENQRIYCYNNGSWTPLSFKMEEVSYIKPDKYQQIRSQLPELAAHKEPVFIVQWKMNVYRIVFLTLTGKLRIMDILTPNTDAQVLS